MARHILLNGEILPSTEPCLSYSNRGLLWGDAFTFKLRGNSCIVYDYDKYYDMVCNILKSLSIGSIDAMFTRKSFANDIYLLLQKNRIYKEFVITVTVFRNSEDTNFLTQESKGSFLVSAESKSPEYYNINKEGLFLKTVDFGGDRSLEMFSAKILQEERLDDLILCDARGIVVRSLHSDIYFINDKTLICATAQNDFSANSIFSCRLKQLVKEKMGMSVVEKKVQVVEAEKFTGMFLADNVNGIRWVVGLDKFRYYPSSIEDIAFEIYSYYRKEIETKKKL
ncbi:MAG: aminotransferase class IV [Bacteroidales bacterium]|nr:aminotransferase class IV [Bacteroidales bacterium]